MNRENRNPIEIETYEEILNALGTAVLYYDHSGVLVNANLMARHLLPEVPVSFKRFQELISFVFEHSLDITEQKDLAVTLQASQTLPAFSEIIRLPDRHFYMVRALTQADKSTIVEIFDVSQIKNDNENIKLLDRDNRLLSRAIHSSQKGIFIASDDDEKRLIFVNKSMDVLFGKPNQSVLGYRLHSFLSTFFPDEWDAINKVIDEHKSGQFWQKIVVPDTPPKWLLLSISAEKKADNEDTVIGFISDETINKSNEQHVLQTQKMDAIGKLAGGVAHDFNNILSIIEGYVRLSEVALKRGEDVSENFARIRTAVKRGSGLTRQLLMFGKHRVTENKILDLCAQVRDIESFLEPLLGVNFKVQIRLPDHPLFIRASGDAISQIVMNLVINARDAMDGMGNVSIRLTDERDGQDNHRAILKVIDTGGGIDEAIIGKIFDPFFTTKEQGKGTGLGLSMVYGIVKQMGAEITVSSVLNEGTVFTVAFPVVENHEYRADQSEIISSSSNLSGKTILVAEDEEDLLMIIKETLRGFGMKVMTAKNGQEALVVQDEYEDKIDFLLTDVVMPELSGLKLASLIREIRPETKILFMSGYPDRGGLSIFDLPSDTIFMAKPVQPDFLRTVLEKMSAGEKIKEADASVWQS